MKNWFRLLGIFDKKTNCLRIREDAWDASSRYETLKNMISDAKLAKKDIEAALNDNLVKKEQFESMAVSIEAAITNVHALIYTSNHIVLTNCALYYEFWKSIKQLYAAEKKLIDQEKIKKPRVVLSVDTKKVKKQLFEHIKKSHLGKIQHIKNNLVKKLHADESEENILAGKKSKFSIRNIHLISSERLIVKERIEANSARNAVEDIKRRIIKSDRLTEKDVRMLETDLNEGIKHTHKDIKFAQQFTEDIWKLKEKDVEPLLAWLGYKLAEYDSKKGTGIKNEVFTRRYEHLKQCEDEVNKKLKETFGNMLKELNLITQENY
jgi:hypothetical protein